MIFLSKKMRNRTTLKRVNLWFFAALLLFCGCRSDSFEFVFMTDIHLEPERKAPQGFAAAMQKINELNPDLVITGGDLVFDALGQSFSRADSLYRLYADLVQNLKIPVYNTIGNHEVFGLYQKSGVSPLQPEYGKAMFKNRIGAGATYRSFDHKGCHFILLDGIGLGDGRYFGYIDSLQIVWLQSDLANVSPQTPIIVCTHIPFMSVYTQMTEGAVFANDPGEVITNGLQVLKLFEHHSLKLVLQGHTHDVEEINYKGIRFVTAGAVCGAWWQGARDGFSEGFAMVSVKNGQIDWRYVTYGWAAEQ
jgi:3',5'-cyclic-AMP phosphodiesterase